MDEYEDPQGPEQDLEDLDVAASDGGARDAASTPSESSAEASVTAGAESPADKPPEAPDVGGVLEAVSSQLGELQLAFDERLRYDATKEESFQQLYRDLEEFRALAGAAQHKPVLMDIILLLDRVEKGLEAQPEDEFIESIRDELSEIMARRGVSAMRAAEDRFDPQRQKAVGTRPAPDEAAHNTVAEVARTGYECDGQILRAAEVVVFRYAPAGGVGSGGGSS
jgi:molecular chaperone GrpE